jgi:hypothetical protein
LKTSKNFKKEPRIKIKNKNIRTEIEIQKTKRIEVYFLREEREKKRKKKQPLVINCPSSTLIHLLRGKECSGTFNDMMKEQVLPTGGTTSVD